MGKCKEITKKVREQVYARDSWDDYPNCPTCGKPGRHQLHHIRKRSQGGDHCAENLINLCVKCHDQIHNGRPEERKELQRKIDEHMVLHYGDDWSETDQKYQKEGI